LEIDTVSHSGSSADSDFILSLNCTDIHTTWTETRAVMGKGQILTLDAIIDIKNSLPFALRGIDSDNGSEFINYHLKRFCDNNKIQFTRSRPYKKDDNAHIEQKNWTHVRKIFGYIRYDSKFALNLMNDLYRNELRLFHNFFQPSVKLSKKSTSALNSNASMINLNLRSRGSANAKMLILSKLQNLKNFHCH